MHSHIVRMIIAKIFKGTGVFSSVPLNIGVVVFGVFSGDKTD